MGRRAGAILAVALVLAGLGGPAGAPAPGARAQATPGCVGELEAATVPQRPGRRLRFGIGPLVQAGQIGPVPGPAVPERPAVTHDALARLAPSRGRAFVLRLNRFFWSDGEEGIRRYLALAERFTSRGYLVELQVRYHPSPEQEGDIAGWTRHVREVVRRFAPNRRVVAIQVANEVNLTFSPDSSDGAYEGARQALVDGVVAAKDEAARAGRPDLEVGFNWAYRTDPAGEESFWRSLRDRGGERFVAAVDWIGLDAYPGTVFPPVESDLDGFRDGMVNGLSSLRCFAAIPGIPDSVPIKVEENGWPTFPGRSREMQADVLRTMVEAVDDYRGTYNVSDYRWFNLRDGDSASPQPFQHFGLIDSGYEEKPAFAVYRELVERLARDEPSAQARPPARRAPRLRLLVRGRVVEQGRPICVRPPIRAAIRGPDRSLVRRVRFRALGRASVDGRAPFARVVDRRAHRGAAHRHVVRVGVRLRDGRLRRARVRYRVCGARAGGRT